MNRKYSFMRLLIAILMVCTLVVLLVAPAGSSTPTPTPTPGPTQSLGYSRSNPAGIDYPLSIMVGTAGISGSHNDYMVRITLVNYLRGDQAWSLIQAANMFNDPPEAGYEYILARIRFEYLTGPTPDTAYDVSPVWFDAVSSSGYQYDTVSVVEPDPSIDSYLYPGASHEGWASFQVAVDDTGPVMTFGRKYDGTGGIWFKLYTVAPTTPVIGITREVKGNILPGVSITLDGTGPVVSDQNGQYEIMATTTGNYTVVAHKDGFRDRTRTINIAGLGTGYAVTCNFQGQYGLIPKAPDIWYALDCVNRWLYPPNPETGLDIWTALDVVNAWLYPIQ